MVLALLAGAVMPSPVFAQATCDPDFLDVMEARAWMEGKREMEIAQKFILKPDSVLEYSCFNTRITEVRNNANSFYAVRAGVGNSMLREPLVRHLDNFSHTLGGGRAPGAPIGTTCNAMYAIWDLLKCDNFNKVDFINFGVRAVLDPRTLPVACGGAAARTTMWNAAIAAANPGVGMPAPAGGMDATNTFFGLLDPTDCGDHDPIPTGVRVGLWNFTVDPPSLTYVPDAVCLAPGCYYDSTDGECH